MFKGNIRDTAVPLLNCVPSDAFNCTAKLHISKWEPVQLLNSKHGTW